MDGLFRLGLAWSLALLIGLLAPHAGAADVVSVGGEWLLSIDSLHQGGATQLQGSTGLRLQGRTLTYPWRVFFDGRVMGMGPLDGKWSSDSRLDRLYLRLYLPAADVTIGKQAVNWGSGYVWSPTDLFSPPDPDDLGGVRKGVTAAVVQLPVGPLDYWSVAVADEKIGVRRRGNVSGVDWSLLTVRDHGDIVIGGDLKGGRGIGWRLAGTYRLPDEPDAPNTFQAVFGADDSWLSGALLWIGEYLMERGEAGGRSDRLFQQLTYQLDEFTSLSGSLLADLTVGQNIWTLGTTTSLGGQSQIAVSLAYVDVPAEAQSTLPDQPLPPSTASARLIATYTRAF